MGSVGVYECVEGYVVCIVIHSHSDIGFFSFKYVWGVFSFKCQFVIVTGSNKVSSRSCSWVKEYISFICELVCSVVCCLMGDMGVVKWMGVGEYVRCFVLLWPKITGSAGAYT